MRGCPSPGSRSFASRVSPSSLVQGRAVSASNRPFRSLVVSSILHPVGASFAFTLRSVRFVGPCVAFHPRCRTAPAWSYQAWTPATDSRPRGLHFRAALCALSVSRVINRAPAPMASARVVSASRKLCTVGLVGLVHPSALGAASMMISVGRDLCSLLPQRCPLCGWPTCGLSVGCVWEIKRFWSGDDVDVLGSSLIRFEEFRNVFPDVLSLGLLLVGDHDHGSCAHVQSCAHCVGPCLRGCGHRLRRALIAARAESCRSRASRTVLLHRQSRPRDSAFRRNLDLGLAR